MDISRVSSWRVATAYLWSMAAWLTFAPVMAGQQELLQSQQGIRASFWQLLLVSGTWCLTSALLTPPIFAIVRRYPISKQARFSRIGTYLVGSIPFLLASVSTRWLILPPWDSTTERYGARSLESFVAYFHLFSNQLWDYVVIVVAAHAYGYFVRVRTQELEQAELKRELAASELQSLKSQLHPHFLFNTLQGISALIDSDRERAKATVLRLSTLLRAALQRANSDLVTLDEEIRFVQHYLEIEKMRLAERLEVRWLISPATRQLLLPQMILQPLVQNAIVHGIAPCRKGGWLEVASRNSGGSLELNIRNSVGGKNEPGLGLGLQNARARLKCLYGEAGTISFEMIEARTAETILVVPALESHHAEGGRVGHLAVGRTP
ncbi:MAG TPA: histidine kinase [Candidatus Cybelea sp.]|nr:histidine kinase [Candidatus Cybelea sp.]